ncbi:SAM-dependent DNA methyltransferase [Roseibium sp. RKSG952]|uniref:SAM-dependent DNA methyltransferase n=1 Tax=Roseibium sp. RKSG952 TaxID=2529384 RepID=UPI0012BB9313|nr:SAM-dependent DNA methyltransferase [Roseibium sp. RKSG952]MTH95922.1 SAM-dependent DNA methyltransferase [Roseibium sp. RKSG952]
MSIQIIEREPTAAPRKSGIGAAMAGGKRGDGTTRPRQKDDWYPTPAEVTQALLGVLDVDGPVWEPCCGDGSLAEVIANAGHEVVGTDLVDRGYGMGHGKDFDVTRAKRLLAPNVITNPPFNIAAEIIEHLMGLNPDMMALLLKSTYWHAAERTPLFNRYPPSRIISLTWRVDFLNLKRPTMEVSWFVWEKDHKGPTTYELVGRPGGPKRRRGRPKGY